VKNRRVLIAVIVLVVLVLAVGGIFFVVQGNQKATVKVATVSAEPLSVVVSASGKVSADRRSDLFPPTQGTLSSIKVKDGQFVKAGELVASMDTDPLQVQAAQAEAGIAGGQAQAASAQDQMPTRADIRAANAGVDASRYQYNLANDAYNQLYTIWKWSPPPVQKSIEATLNAAKLQKLQTYAAYKQSVAARVKLSKTHGLHATVQAGQATADSSEEALALANKQIDQSQLTSPIDGYVVFNALGAPAADGTTPKAGPGAAVSPAAAPFTIYALNATYFAAEVDETDISRVKNGLVARVTLDAFPGETFDAKVTRIAPLAILTTSGGTAFPVYVPLDNTGKAVRIGMQGNADIQISEITSAITIPIEALFDEGGKSYVYVVGPGDKLKKTQVTVGTLTDTRAQIKSGVKEGDKVALSGGTVKLTDGLVITPQQQ
jgi:HlyD family secretion protein